jgi:hypothetical protein
VIRLVLLCHGSSMATCQPGVLLWLRRGSDDEVDDTPIESTADTELYKLTLPMDVTAAPQVYSSSRTQPALTTETKTNTRCPKSVLHVSKTRSCAQPT